MAVSGTEYVLWAPTLLDAAYISNATWSNQQIGPPFQSMMDFPDDALSYDELCNYCGSRAKIDTVCPRCGAPPREKRQYGRGEFIVKSHVETEQVRKRYMLSLAGRPKRWAVVEMDRMTK